MYSRSTNCERQDSTRLKGRPKPVLRYAAWLALLSLFVLACSGWVLASTAGPSQTPSILNPASTPAHDIYHLSLFVMALRRDLFFR